MRLALLAAVAAQVQALPQWPSFSWDTVPVFYHSCNFTGEYTDEALKTVAKFPMVTIEKGQEVALPAPPYAETKIGNTLKRVKALNKNISTIFYYNSVLDWPFYKLHEEFLNHKDWWLKKSATDASPCRIGGDGSFPVRAGGGAGGVAAAAVGWWW